MVESIPQTNTFIAPLNEIDGIHKKGEEEVEWSNEKKVYDLWYYFLSWIWTPWLVS